MPAYKGEEKSTWFVSFYYKNWQGANTRKLKRGFQTKKEALAWERQFLQEKTSDLNMTFESFFEVYENDIKGRLKENTWISKLSIIEKKIMPYFKDKKINEIKPADVIKWRNVMLDHVDENGKKYSPVYLKTMHNQLSAIFNHAVRFYELKSNPAQKAGNMGSEKSKEIVFWTKSDYLKFIPSMMEKPMSYYAFQTLYFTGLRVGELLALTPNDIDFEARTLTVSKSFQRIKGRDVITTPKTVKSNRTITIPTFLCEQIQECINLQYKLKSDDRIFHFTKSYLHKEMDRGAKQTGVKRIKIHGLRHSHVSALIDMGFTPLAIADRVGHESIEITYRYAHLFPSKQREIADSLTMEE